MGLQRVLQRTLVGAFLGSVALPAQVTAEHSHATPILTQGLFATATTQHLMGADLMGSFRRAAQLTAPHTAILMLTTPDLEIRNHGFMELLNLRPQARNLERLIDIMSPLVVLGSPGNIGDGIDASFANSAIIGENIINPHIRPGTCINVIAVSETINRIQTSGDNTVARDRFVRSSFDLQDSYYYRSIRVPGSYRDATALMAYHEIDHCRIQGRFFEHQSDAFANMFYFRERENLQLDPEFPYFWRSIRAIQYMIRDPETSIYATNSLSPLPGERWLSNRELDEAIIQVQESRKQVFARALRDSGLVDLPTIRVNIYSLRANIESDGAEIYRISREDMDRAQEIIDERDETAALRWLQRNPPPPHVIERTRQSLTLAAELRFRAMSRARGAEHIFPHRMYQAAVSLLREGALNDLPFGKLFAERFVDGARRYAPDLFGVPPRDRLGPPDLSAAMQATPVFRGPDDHNQILGRIPAPQSRP